MLTNGKKTVTIIEAYIIREMRFKLKADVKYEIYERKTSKKNRKKYIEKPKIQGVYLQSCNPYGFAGAFTDRLSQLFVGEFLRCGTGGSDRIEYPFDFIRALYHQ